MQTVFLAREKKARLRSKGAAFRFSFPSCHDSFESGRSPQQLFPIVHLQLRSLAEIIACFLFSLCFRFVIMMGC